jgi:selenocysteine lyase/cysteine desulfurase
MKALDFEEAEGVARLDHGFPSGTRSAWTLGSFGVFEQAGWDWVHERAATLAENLAHNLAHRGLEVLPRSRSTLVSWKSTDPEADVGRLAEENVVVRYIPAFGVVRASVGAWSSEQELDRLMDLVTAD